MHVSPVIIAVLLRPSKAVWWDSIAHLQRSPYALIPLHSPHFRTVIGTVKYAIISSDTGTWNIIVLSSGMCDWHGCFHVPGYFRHGQCPLTSSRQLPKHVSRGAKLDRGAGLQLVVRNIPCRPRVFADRI